MRAGSGKAARDTESSDERFAGLKGTSVHRDSSFAVRLLCKKAGRPKRLCNTRRDSSSMSGGIRPVPTGSVMLPRLALTKATTSATLRTTRVLHRPKVQANKRAIDTDQSDSGYL